MSSLKSLSKSKSKSQMSLTMEKASQRVGIAMEFLCCSMMMLGVLQDQSDCILTKTCLAMRRKTLTLVDLVLRLTRTT